MQLSVLYERMDAKLDSLQRTARDAQTEMKYWQAYNEAGNWVFNKIWWRWNYRSASLTANDDDEIVLPWAALSLPIFVWDVSDKSKPPLIGRTPNYLYKYIELLSSGYKRYAPGNPSTSALYSPADLTGIAGAVLTFTDLSATMTQTQADLLVGKHLIVGGYEAFYEISAISVAGNTITTTTTIGKPGDDDYNPTGYAVAAAVNVEPKGAERVYMPNASGTYTVLYPKRFRPAVVTTDDIDIDDRLISSFVKMCAGYVKKESDDLLGAQKGLGLISEGIQEINDRFSTAQTPPGVRPRMSVVDPYSKFGLNHDTTIGCRRGRRNGGMASDWAGYH